jgi:hypothetical protein
MELYTLNRSFQRTNVIDQFHSAIWTERYYGDGEFQLVVPGTTDMVSKLMVGTFMMIDGSDEPMILENIDIGDGKLTASGITLTKWLNNRFIRVSANHEDKYWYIDGGPAGWVLWEIVFGMCTTGSPYLNGTIDIGVPNPQRFAIPNLALLDCDMSGGNVSIGVPFGPVYDALREIATTYQIGMQIILQPTDTSYALLFRSYKGLDHTSAQITNPIVRYSPQMDSFTNIKELRSIAALKTLVYSFAPSLKPDEGQPDLRTRAGESILTDAQYTGFDLRALMVLADDISTDMVGGSQQNLVNILDSRAYDALTNNHYVRAVDGEIVPDAQLQYGVHYNLGDLIEVQGNSGVIQSARITEYIRTQDAAGEKSYPTVSMIG